MKPVSRLGKRPGSESDVASDEASDGSEFDDTDDEQDAHSGGDDAELLDGGPLLLVDPPTGVVPLAAGPASGAAGGRVWDARDGAWTHEQVVLMDTVWEGLNKTPWFVYPGHVGKLLRATALLLRQGTPPTRCVRSKGSPAAVVP